MTANAVDRRAFDAAAGRIARTTRLGTGVKSGLPPAAEVVEKFEWDP